MKFLLDNPWIVVVIAGLVAQVLKGLRSAKTPEDGGAPPRAGTAFDPDEAERARRIREEIRRKIIARRGGEPGPEPEPPLPVSRSPEATPPVRGFPSDLPEVIREVMAPKPPPAKPPPVAAATASREEQLFAAEETERQRSLEKQLLGASGLLESAERRVAFEQSTADTQPAAQALLRAGLLEELRDPDALRRAFLLREVLGPPLALR